MCYTPCMDGDKLLTVEEVAERLRVNPYTVRRWLRDGTLSGKLMGGRRGGYRIAESELARFLATRPGKA
jgi:excisionase family DNA binding protein